MKRKIYVSLVGLMLTAMMLTGCGKDVSKMDDAELYAYLMDMDESKREDFIEKLDNEQQYRAYEVLTKAEIMGTSDDISEDETKDNESEDDEVNVNDETVANEKVEFAPTEEILNATLADGKVQVGNTVFQMGGVLTVGDFVEKYSDEWDCDDIDLDLYSGSFGVITIHSRAMSDILFNIQIALPCNVEDEYHVKTRDMLVREINILSDKTKENTWYAGGVEALDTGFTWENYAQYFEENGYSESDAVGNGDVNDIEGYNGAFLCCLLNTVSADGRRVQLTYSMNEENGTGKMLNMWASVAFLDDKLEEQSALEEEELRLLEEEAEW